MTTTIESFEQLFANCAKRGQCCVLDILDDPDHRIADTLAVTASRETGDSHGSRVESWYEVECHDRHIAVDWTDYRAIFFDPPESTPDPMMITVRGKCDKVDWRATLRLVQSSVVDGRLWTIYAVEGVEAE